MTIPIADAGGILPDLRYGSVDDLPGPRPRGARRAFRPAAAGGPGGPPETRA